MRVEVGICQVGTNKRTFLLTIRFPEFHQNMFNPATLKRNQGLNPGQSLEISPCMSTELVSYCLISELGKQLSF